MYVDVCGRVCVTTFRVHNRWEVEVWWNSSSQSTLFSFIHYTNVKQPWPEIRKEKRRKGQQLVCVEKSEDEEESKRKNTMSSSPPTFIITFIQPLSHFFSLYTIFSFIAASRRKAREKAKSACCHVHVGKRKLATNVTHGKINWSDNDCLMEKTHRPYGVYKQEKNETLSLSAVLY
jgi:hypothetical protein